MRVHKKTDAITKAGLQFRMTAVVTSAVLAVSAIILIIMAFLIRKDYETMLDERISDDLSSITQVIEQRMLNVENATATMANVAKFIIGDTHDTDSLLYHSVISMGDVQGVSVIFLKGFMQGNAGYVERYAHFDSDRNVIIDTYYIGDEIESQSFGQNYYVKGKTGWSEPIEDPAGGPDIVRYYVPLRNSDGERIGIVCTSVSLNFATGFVTRYKLRKDIDISIYSEKGAMLVAPDDYILELAPEDLIVWERSMDHMGVRFVLSADRNIIDRNVRDALLTIAVLIIIMFFVITLAIMLAVRYVARPFIRKHQQTEKEKALVDQELRLAAAAQNEIVPHVFPPFPDRKEIELFACLYPARNVGGDLYDYFLVGDRLYFCIGDVSGKGLQASLFMAATHYLFRSVAAGMSASDAVRQINISLCADNEKCRFVTFWYGCLDLSSGELVYVNAGHDSPILIHDGMADTFPLSENMPLGALDEAEFISCSRRLEPGDMLLLYTDGVTEAMDAEGHEFGKRKLMEAVGTSCGNDSSGLIGNVLSRVRQHASGAVQSDDITMLCLKFISQSETKS